MKHPKKKRKKELQVAATQMQQKNAGNLPLLSIQQYRFEEPCSQLENPEARMSIL